MFGVRPAPHVILALATPLHSRNIPSPQTLRVYSSPIKSLLGSASGRLDSLWTDMDTSVTFLLTQYNLGSSTQHQTA